MSATPVGVVDVLIHPGKTGAVELARVLEVWLEQRVDVVRCHRDLGDFADHARAVCSSSPDLPPPDLVVVLGGDGALLGAVRAFSDAPVPTLGINFGQVGFLASTPASRWEETLESALAGRAKLEPRLRLDLTVPGATAGRHVALNDVVLSRAPDQSMLRAALYVGDDWVTDYRADGLIVATPSGSTAYALSAGGPLLGPSLEAFLVTPICSQSLSNRPIVLEPQVELAIELVDNTGPADVIVDGCRVGELEAGRRLTIVRHPRPYPIVALPSLDPYRRWRERLGWTGSVTDRPNSDGLR